MQGFTSDGIDFPSRVKSLLLESSRHRERDHPRQWREQREQDFMFPSVVSICETGTPNLWHNQCTLMIALCVLIEDNELLSESL